MAGRWYKKLQLPKKLHISQIYFSIFSHRVNILAVKKYKTTTNQIRESRNLNETIGIVLVKAVKKSINRFI